MHHHRHPVKHIIFIHSILSLVPKGCSSLWCKMHLVNLEEAFPPNLNSSNTFQTPQLKVSSETQSMIFSAWKILEEQAAHFQDIMLQSKHSHYNREEWNHKTSERKDSTTNIVASCPASRTPYHMDPRGWRQLRHYCLALYSSSDPTVTRSHWLAPPAIQQLLYIPRIPNT